MNTETTSKDIFPFYGKGNPFSNFYHIVFKWEGNTFSSSEQAFMYAKAVVFNAEEVAQEMLRTLEPFKAKRLGNSRRIQYFDANLWDAVRYDLMVDVLRAKFMHPMLKGILLNTGDSIIVEASPTDTDWGVGIAKDDPRIYNPELWQGKNLLGKALMEVRDYYTI